jgi:hypothetical protein
MTTRSKLLLLFTALLLLAVVLLWYRLPEVTAYLIKHELQARGFTDVVLDIDKLSATSSRINRLSARHPAFTLSAEGITLRYRYDLLRQARLEAINITSLQLALHGRQGNNDQLALAGLPTGALSAIPFERLQIQQASIVLPGEHLGITQFDLQTSMKRQADGILAQVNITAGDRPPLLLHVVAENEKSWQLLLNAAPVDSPVVTLQARALELTADRLTTQLVLDARLDTLRPLLEAWLPQYPVPAEFTSLSSEGSLEYLAAAESLHTELDIKLAGENQSLAGPVAVTLQHDQLAVVVGRNFRVSAQQQAFDQVNLPELLLTASDDLNCSYELNEKHWQCDAARLTMTMPELHHPSFTMHSQPGVITLQSLTGNTETWQAKAGLDLPAVKLVLPERTIALDHLRSQLDATTDGINAYANLARITIPLPDNQLRLDKISTQVKATATGIYASGTVLAADGKLTMPFKARHDLQNQRGSADIELPATSLDAKYNIPGKLLHRWPYPVHIESGQVSGQTRLSWQQRSGQFSLDQATRLKLEQLQGQFRQYPFTNLRGAIHIKGIEHLHISASDGLQLASINPGFMITDILVRGEASRQPGQALVATLDQGQASLFGGQVNTAAAMLDLNSDKNRLVLNVHGIDIARLMKLEQKQGLRSTGTLNGTLPVIIGKDGISMTDGKLSAPPPYGVIQYTGNERVSALAKNNTNVALLLQALSDFRYNLLDAELDYAPDGQLQARVRLHGSNPELEGGRPVHLNINLEENIPQLLKSLQFADEISRQLEKGLQRGQ